MHDVRFAVRQLLKNPGFALIAVITLAFGIGANASMFSFANGLLLRPPPYPRPDELMRLYRVAENNYFGAFSPADFLELRREQGSAGKFAGMAESKLVLAESEKPPVWWRVSADLFDILEVRPMLGRSFRADEEIPGADRVVLISYRLWESQFGGRKDVIGQTLRANDGTFEIVGVLPKSAAEHRLFQLAQIFSPLSFTDSERASREARWVNVVGRRNASFSEAQSQAFVEGFGARLARDYAAENGDTRWRAESLNVNTMSPAGRTLIAMLVALSTFVLLIACSNLANLILARIVNNARELTVRAALGASRWRLLSPILCELSLLALAGGAGALLVTQGTTEWLRGIIVNGGGPPFEFPTDWRVLAFGLSVSFLVIAVFGAGAAFFLSSIKAADGLKANARGSTAGPGWRRLRHTLIGAQFALAMILLGGAGLFLRGSQNLMKEHFGWRAEDVVQARFILPEERYADGESLTGFYRELKRRVRNVPGVRAASVSYHLPFLGLRAEARFIGNAAQAADKNAGISAKLNGISTEYFDVTGTRLIAGRPFAAQDDAGGAKVAIVNDALARELFPNENAIGRRIAIAATEAPDWMEIVGIAENVKSVDIAQNAAPYQCYRPIMQHPSRDPYLAVRAEGVAPAALLGSIRDAFASLDPSLIPKEVMTAPRAMQFITSQMALCRNLMSAFAVLGLLLATLGIYGTIARMVAQRTSEIGIRMALGAQLGEVARLVLGAGVRISAIGSVLGLLGAAALARFMVCFLPRLNGDPGWVLPSAMIALIATALAACWIPARRAMRINPMEALRYE